MAPKKDSTAQDVIDDVVKVEDHKKDVGELNTAITNINVRVMALEDKIGTPEKTSTYLETIQVDSKKFDSVITKSILDAIKDNVDFKTGLSNFVNTIDRNFLFSNLKRFWGWIIIAIAFFMGIFGREIILSIAQTITPKTTQVETTQKQN